MSIVPSAVLVSLATSSSALAQASTPQGIHFQSSRLPELFGVILVIAASVLAYKLIRRHGMPRLRALSPLNAIPDAIGRATESGTPLVYITGWGGDMGRPTTMASMGILSSVAKQAAEYNCRLVFPSHDPVITSVASDTLAQAASMAGRPEWVSQTDTTFVTQSQFGYAAAIEGLVAREHPGAVLLLGTFEGEALILAEAAHNSGALTIAGTDSTIQLAFFLVACDYTLMGEELFAAASALSENPHSRAAIWAQDWLKYGALAILVIGTVLLWLAGYDTGPILAR